MANLRCHSEHRHPGREATGIHTSCVRTCLMAMFVALILVACGDDDSDFATRPSDDLSSSVSSSSRRSGGLSSLDGEDPESSSKGDGGSDAAMTSSSIDDVMYSFGVTPKSSNNETSVSSSSTRSSSISEYIRVPCDVETDENCFEDVRDGQTYKTVKIGDQWWMAENLSYEVDSSFCYIELFGYDSKHDSAEYCDKYGRFYTWAAAVGKSEDECGYGHTCSLPSGNIQGVCPDGWHLPSNDEWNTLFDAVGGSSTAGIMLKSTFGWYDNGNGSDAYGFSALPTGFRDNSGGFYGLRDYALFWSSTEFGRASAYYMYLYYSYESASLGYYAKYRAKSVRCLKD